MTEVLDPVEVPGSGPVTSILTPAAANPAWLFVYAPGAGSNVNDPFGAYAARVLPAAGISVLRFQFRYQELKRSGPDPNPLLERTWSAALARSRELASGARLVAGGRSMGGRIASQVADAGEEVDALALFAYPLHPPGRPDQRRDSHLPRISAPALFCSGTRDAFASADELAAAAAMVNGSRLHLLEGADHGFAVPKSSGRTRQDVWQEACDALQGFLKGLS